MAIRLTSPDARYGRSPEPAQVLFAVNRRYLINEKGALASAARLPITVGDLAERAGTVWQAIGLGAFDEALAELGSIERELAGLTAAAL